jgi:hypothetical protein
MSRSTRISGSCPFAAEAIPREQERATNTIRESHSRVFMKLCSFQPIFSGWARSGPTVSILEGHVIPAKYEHQGWNDASQLHLLMNFLDSQHVRRRQKFDGFLAGYAAEENDCADSPYRHLTEEQREQILDAAIEQTAEDAPDDAGDFIRAALERRITAELLDWVADEDFWRDHLDFDPETGQLVPGVLGCPRRPAHGRHGRRPHSFLRSMPSCLPVRVVASFGGNERMAGRRFGLL